jgi:hypothetical protein
MENARRVNNIALNAQMQKHALHAQLAILLWQEIARKLINAK